MNNQPRVVIVGGGFGGLCAARGLAGAPISVTLSDKRNYYLFRPMLYQNWTRRETHEGRARDRGRAGRWLRHRVGLRPRHD